MNFNTELLKKLMKKQDVVILKTGVFRRAEESAFVINNTVKSRFFASLRMTSSINFSTAS